MSDAVRVTNLPGSNAAVALELAKAIVSQGIEEPNSRAAFIDLYVDCYNATYGNKLK